MSSNKVINKILGSRLVFLLCAIILVCCVSYIHMFYPVNIVSYDRDVWHHMASINALMESPFNAVNPHILSDEPSRTFMPWYVLLAIIGNVFDLTAIKILGLSAFFSLTILMVGIHLFSQKYYENKMAPIILMGCLFGTWGFSTSYTGYYNPQSLVYSFSYPYAITLALGFIGWWLVLKQLESIKINYYLIISVIVLCAFMFATHQLQGAFAIGGMGLFSLFAKQSRISIRIKLLGAILLGTLLSGFWFYFNPLTIILTAGNANWQTANSLFEPVNIAIFTGIATFGILGIYDYKRKKIKLDLLLGLSVITAAYVIGETIGNPISHRFHPFITIFLQISLAGFLLAEFTDEQPYRNLLLSIQRTTGILLIFLCFIKLPMTVENYRETRNYLNHQKSSGPETWHPDILDSMAQLQQKIHSGDILIAQKSTAYPVQAYRMKVVSIPRPFPLVKDMAERQKASIDFFSLNISDAERWHIIQTYNVSYIIYRLSWLDSPIANDLDNFGTTTIINDDLALLEIDFKTHPVIRPLTKEGVL